MYLYLVGVCVPDRINFLSADGAQFVHPLHHLGKSESDLPLIAIDSFKHMFVFPQSVKLHVEYVFRSTLFSLFSTAFAIVIYHYVTRTFFLF